jgi:DNA polymerase
LREGATQLVFADGSPDAELMFIGEAPGANEDKQGKPFVGASGKFLGEMLEGIGSKREDVYITNIVKYRPPGNRDPEPKERADFMPYLARQIEIIQPKLIIFLGRHAMSVFLPELKISEAHGKPVRKNGQVYLPLFHPAAALYNGGLRQTLIEDFAKIPVILKKINESNNPSAHE